MKLISNTNFGQTLSKYNDSDYRRIRDSFDNFLKQPLELWMFVPCELVDDVWVPLEEPNHLDYKYEKYKGELHFKSEFHKNKYSDKYYQYQQAKERVLFDGLEVVHIDKHRITIECDFLQLDYSFVKCGFEKQDSIEDLTMFNPTLTQTAINQIYK